MTDPSDKARIRELETQVMQLKAELTHERTQRAAVEADMRETAEMLRVTQRQLEQEQQGFQRLAFQLGKVEARKDKLAAEAAKARLSDGGMAS